MRTKDLLTDLALVGVAGLGAAKVMDRATQVFLDHQSDEDTRREQEAADGMAYDVAARKAVDVVGADASARTVGRLGMAVHYSLAFGWVPVYLVLRRRFGMGPLAAGMASGMSMAVLVDEIANPVFGLTPGPRAYPLATHLRGVVGHVVYGAAVAVLVESTDAFLRRR